MTAYLVEITVRSSLILLIALALLPLLRHQSAALRHWVLFTALMCAGAMPVAAWVFPEWETVDVAAIVPARVAEQVVPRLTTVASSAAAEPHTLGPPAAKTTRADVSKLAFLLWISGTVLSVGMLGVGLIRLRRIDAAATPVPHGPWHLRDADAAAVRVTAQPGLLLVWGAVRPSIIIPHTALAWSPERIDAVLRHELAHVGRGDWLLQIAAEAVRALYWFNPLVWITCARLRAECELACDDTVIASGTHGPDYATHVVEIARELKTQRWLPAPAIVRSSTLERRVRAMLDNTRNRRALSTRARGIAVACMLATSMAVAAVAAQSFVTLRGTIVDPSQGVLPGVKVVLVNDQTQAKYEIQSDRAGQYEFVGLPPGDYTMNAALPGFSQFSSRVTIGAQNLQQDLTMSVGRIQESITLTPGPQPPRVTTVDPERARRYEEMRVKRAAECAARAAGGAPSGIGGNLKVPIKLRDVRPVYPESQQATGGVVVVNATIATNGSVDRVEIVSSPNEELSQAASDAVRQWEFDATLLNCEPIETAMTVTVTFKAP
jgi:TonB family protein